MASNFSKFKEVLHELFMMDQADLDFGIYRIMNQKRAEINDYLDNKLKSEVERCLDEYGGESGNNLENKIAQLAAGLTDAGVDPETSPKYNDLKKQLEDIGSKDELEGNVYSHLTTFFKRYYDKGDFISLRRYKKDVYALPYEGEEVKLYWANSDQYYIKSSEYFRNYSFNIHNGKKVSFELIEASTEQNNNKIQGDKERRFALYKEKPLAEVEGELKIYFTYEPTDKKVSQKDLAKEALQTLAPLIPQDFYELLTKKPSEKDANRTLLEKHLNDYVAKNTFDYFIHKDLGTFLRRELDFYIKNEILYIDDLEYNDENRLFRQLSVVKTIKKIGHNIIQFLASLEDFQKKLWLKKKFVVESNYCITLDRVPEMFYAEIAANAAQREEWVKLFAIDEIGADKSKLSCRKTSYSNPLSVEFLKENPYLVLDTAFFGDDFKRRLIGSMDDIDEKTDGLLISSENFQALNLLQEKYSNTIKGIYIDPPYNTAASEILYKNSYKHSSWLSLINDRMIISRNLLNNTGILCFTIDDFEFAKSKDLLDQVYGADNLLGVIPIRNNPSGRSTTKGISIAHEYAILYSNSDDAIVGRLERNEKQKARYNEQDDKGVFEWTNFRKHGGNRAESPTMYYPIFISTDCIRIPIMEFDDETKVWNLLELPGNNEKIIYPIDEEGKERRWKWGYDRIIENLDEFCVRPDRTGELGVYVKTRTKEDGVLPLTWWEKKEYSATAYGTNTLKNIFGDLQVFSYPKSINAVVDSIKVLNANNNSTVLDFFAGSGTTGHAVINLNREDGGDRKYILVEMGEFFDAVTKPRIQKVIYSKDWKNGKPVSRQGSSHCFKYIRLESYEDTLNNLSLKTNDFAQALNENNGEMKESFLLGYMLDTETKSSLFNTEWFADPFNFQLNITRKNELRREKIDLVDTFNYLIGLNVHSINYPVEGVCTVTGITRAGEKTFILWRDTNKIPNDKLNSIVEKLDINPRDNEFDRIYCNGNNNLENIRKEDQTWKVILIEQEFAKRMFEIE